MAIYKSALDLVGNTPLLEVTHFEKTTILKQQFLLSLNTLIRQALLKTELLRQLSKMQKRQASLSLTL